MATAIDGYDVEPIDGYDVAPLSAPASVDGYDVEPIDGYDVAPLNAGPKKKQSDFAAGFSSPLEPDQSSDLWAGIKGASAGLGAAVPFAGRISRRYAHPPIDTAVDAPGPDALAHIASGLTRGIPEMIAMAPTGPVGMGIVAGAGAADDAAYSEMLRRQNSGIPEGGYGSQLATGIGLQSRGEGDTGLKQAARFARVPLAGVLGGFGAKLGSTAGILPNVAFGAGTAPVETAVGAYGEGADPFDPKQLAMSGLIGAAGGAIGNRRPSVADVPPHIGPIELVPEIMPERLALPEPVRPGELPAPPVPRQLPYTPEIPPGTLPPEGSVIEMTPEGQGIPRAMRPEDLYRGPIEDAPIGLEDAPPAEMAPEFNPWFEPPGSLPAELRPAPISTPNTRRFTPAGNPIGEALPPPYPDVPLYAEDALPPPLPIPQRQTLPVRPKRIEAAKSAPAAEVASAPEAVQESPPPPLVEAQRGPEQTGIDQPITGNGDQIVDANKMVEPKQAKPGYELRTDPYNGRVYQVEKRPEDMTFDEFEQNYRDNLDRLLSFGPGKKGDKRIGVQEAPFAERLSALEEAHPDWVSQIDEKMSAPPSKANQATGEKHFIFLDRDGRRVPIAGPYESEAALQADADRVNTLIRERDQWTDFDTRIYGKTSDPTAIEKYTQRIQKIKTMEPKPAAVERPVIQEKGNANEEANQAQGRQEGLLEPKPAQGNGDRQNPGKEGEVKPEDVLSKKYGIVIGPETGSFLLGEQRGEAALARLRDEFYVRRKQAQDRQGGSLFPGQDAVIRSNIIEQATGDTPLARELDSLVTTASKGPSNVEPQVEGAPRAEKQGGGPARGQARSEAGGLQARAEEEVAPAPQAPEQAVAAKEPPADKHVFSRDEIEVSKPKASTRKTPHGTNGSVKVSVEAPFKVTDSNNWHSLENVDNIKATVEGRIDFKTGAKPKRSDPVWSVWDKKDNLLANKLTYDDAVEFAKDHVMSSQPKIAASEAPAPPPDLAARNLTKQRATQVARETKGQVVPDPDNPKKWAVTKPEPSKPVNTSSDKYLQARREGEVRAKREGQWHTLMTSKDPESVVGEMSADEVKGALERLNASPGDNPKVRKALEAATPKPTGERSPEAMGIVPKSVSKLLSTQQKYTPRSDLATAPPEVQQAVKTIEASRYEIPATGGEEARKANIVRRIGQQHLTPETMLMELDNNHKEGGPLTKLAYDDVLEGHEKALRAVRDHHNALLDILDSAGLKKVSDRLKLSKVYGGNDAKMEPLKMPDAGTKRLTPAQIMSLYAHTGDVSTRSEIARGVKVNFSSDRNGEPIKLTARDTAAVNQWMNEHPDLKRVVDESKKSIQKLREPLFAIVKKLRSTDLNRHEGYWPRRRNSAQEVPADMLPDAGSMIDRKLENMGFLKSRGQDKTPLLIGDFFQEYSNYIHDASMVIGLAEPVHKANAVINHPILKHAIERTYGGSFLRNLNDYLKTAANPGYIESMSTFERIGRQVNRNFARAALTANPSPALKQVGGIMRLWAEIPAKYLAQGVKSAADPAVYKEMIENSGALWDRHEGNPIRIASPTLGEASPTLGELTLPEIGKRFGKAVLSGDVKQAYGSTLNAIDKIKLLNWADSTVSRTAWAARKAQVEAEHADWTPQQKMDWVVKTVNRDINRTQNSSSPLDMSNFARNTRHSNLATALTLFASDSNKQANLLLRAARTGGKDGARIAGATALNVLWSATVNTALKYGPAVAGAYLAGKELDKSKYPGIVKDAAWNAARNLAGAVYGMDKVVGTLQDALGKSKYGLNSSSEYSTPLEQVVNGSMAGIMDIIRAAGDIGEEYKSGPNKGKSKAEVEWKRGAEKLALSLSMGAGLPIRPNMGIIKRGVDAYDYKPKQPKDDLGFEKIKF